MVQSLADRRGLTTEHATQWLGARRPRDAARHGRGRPGDRRRRARRARGGRAPARRHRAQLAELLPHAAERGERRPRDPHRPRGDHPRPGRRSLATALGMPVEARTVAQQGEVADAAAPRGRRRPRRRARSVARRTCASDRRAGRSSLWTDGRCHCMPCRRQRRLIQGQGGSTLIELLVAMPIAIVLLGLVVQSLGQAGHDQQDIERRTEMLTDAQIGLERMTRELRQATWVYFRSSSVVDINVRGARRAPARDGVYRLVRYDCSGDICLRSEGAPVDLPAAGLAGLREVDDHHRRGRGRGQRPAPRPDRRPRHLPARRARPGDGRAHRRLRRPRLPARSACGSRSSQLSARTARRSSRSRTASACATARSYAG